MSSVRCSSSVYRHDVIDQTHLVGTLGVEAAGGIEDFTGIGDADQVDEAQQALAGIEGAETRRRHAECAGVSGEADVAGGGQLQPAAHAEAVDHGDDRSVERADLLQHALKQSYAVAVGKGFVALTGRQVTDIVAGGKCLRALAAQNEYANVRILRSAVATVLTGR